MQTNHEYKNKSKLFKIDLGNACQTFRERLNIPRREVSEALGCTVQQVKNFEEGYTFDPAIYIYYCEKFNNKMIIQVIDL